MGGTVYHEFLHRSGGVGSYNSIDNFYNPAPCGQPRPLKSGILLKAGEGRSYNMIWVCISFFERPFTIFV